MTKPRRATGRRVDDVVPTVLEVSMEPEARERLCRRLAIGFGVGLALIEVAYNWGNPSWWPFILVDYIAVALLLYGAWRSTRILAAGWGFACAMFYMAFFSVWDRGAPALLLAGMGSLFIITVLGLLLSVSSALADRSP
jgi:hypothetical protein